MPLLNLGDEHGHTAEIFIHSWASYACETRVCDECGAIMSPTFSPGTTLTYFEEGRPRVIENLGDQPVTVTSHAQHKALMKAAGVTQGNPSYMRGRKGYEV